MKRKGITANIIKLLTSVIIAAGLLAGCAATVPKENEPEAVETSKKKAMDMFIQGKVAESKNQFGEAIASYLEALQYDPDSGEIAYALAEAFVKNGKIKSAHYYTKLATKLDPTNKEAWQLLQRIEQHEGNYEKAIEAMEMYMKLSKDKDFNSVLKLAYFYFSAGNAEKGKSILLSSIKEKDMPAQDLQQAAELLAMNDFIDEALSIYKRIIERDPADENAWISIGEIYAQNGKLDEADQTFTEALRKNPGSVKLLVELGNFCLSKNDWKGAITYFEQADATGIDNMKIRKTLCALYYYDGRDEDGKAALDSLVAKGEDDAGLYFSLGKTMNYLERYDEAVNYYSTGFSKVDKNVNQESLLNAFAGMARSLIKLGRAEEAVDLIRKQAGSFIEDKTILKEIEATIYTELKRYEDAAAILEWLSESDPQNISYLLRLSLVYDFLGRFDKAEEALLNILKIEPDHTLALNNLAYMYMEHNQNLDKAIGMVKRSLEKEPKNGAYLDTLGWGYFKKGNLKEARKYIEAALNVAEASDKGVIYEHYGDVLVKLGKAKEAADAYNSAIKLGEDSARIQPKIDGIK
ncbi:tetratricopeptide repeat protein [bacterium]|nr:tetratricopeptide repeat protein [bacterium]